jgi:hypothetical protein
MTMTRPDLVEHRLRSALSDRVEENMVALAIVLVEQALNYRRRDGTLGTAAEVKAFVNRLTGGMIDLAETALVELEARHEQRRH